MIASKKALLIVDAQNDFCPKGALAVPEGDKIITVLNKYIKYFSKNKLPIFASRDWHPKKTTHFKKFKGVWPVHCVRYTLGARFHSRLQLPRNAIVLSKGMDPKRDSYSAFQAQDRIGKRLLKLLRELKIKELYIGGLATDYCVKFSVLDALKYGFKVKILIDAIKGVNLKPKDSQKAIAGMIKRGAIKTTIKKISSWR